MSDTTELHIAAYERALRAKGRSERTIQSYAETLLLLDAFTAAADIAELSKGDLEAFMADQLEEHRASTAGVRFRNLRAWYNWCVAEEIIDVSPMARMTEPRPTDEPVPVVSDDDLRALLKACDGKQFEDRRDTAIIRLWCEPGSPRLEEMASITVDGLDMRAGMVTLHGKGDKIRVIPFGAKTGTALDRYLRLRARQPRADRARLWLASTTGRGDGHPITGSGLTQMLRRRCDQAGIKRIHPHQFRHTAAHMWKAGGGNDDDAMALFGWSSREMPLRYGRSAQVDRAQKAARRLSQADRL